LKDQCETCNKDLPLDYLLNKYEGTYIQKECKECKTERFDGCFYEPLFPSSNIEQTFKQKKLINRLITWCFG